MSSTGRRVLGCDAVSLAQLGEEILRSKSYMRFRVRGTSMHPTIQSGEVIWVHSCRAEDLALGEIVFFKTDTGAAVVHRITMRENSGGRIWLSTKGDARLTPDRPIEDSQVIGKAVMVERQGRVIRLDTRLSRLTGSTRNRVWPLWFRIRRLVGRSWQHQERAQTGSDAQLE